MVYLLVRRCQYLAINFIPVPISANTLPKSKVTTRNEFLRILSLAGVKQHVHIVPTVCCNAAHNAIRSTELRVLDTIRRQVFRLEKGEVTYV
jgi:hypothetical protein